MNLAHWQSYSDNQPKHTVVGTVLVQRGVRSPQLHNRRDILVYLPASYELTDKRYPVVYMHDGQNLFDEAASFAGEWRVDETMQDLERDGIEAIIIGIPNSGEERLNEYSPFPHPHMGGGSGHAYLDFIADTIKPMIDAEFRTRPDRANTGLIGSSMGGLISLYGFFSHAETFGFAGVMSPSLWFGWQAIYDYVIRAPFRPGRLYLDVGTKEARGRSAAYRKLVAEMQALLVEKGYADSLMYVEERNGQHHEAAWARRLPAGLRFLIEP